MRVTGKAAAVAAGSVLLLGAAGASSYAAVEASHPAASQPPVVKVIQPKPAPPVRIRVQQNNQNNAPSPPAQPPRQSNTPPGLSADPWTTIQNYYAFISSGDYADAWYLLGNGSATGQSYQGFVNGYANSADQTVTENWESGDTVSVNITALDTATGQVQHFSGTYTVDNGMIAGANITGG